MALIVILVLSGIVIVDVLWEHLTRVDHQLDAKYRHRNLMRELRRHGDP